MHLRRDFRRSEKFLGLSSRGRYSGEGYQEMIYVYVTDYFSPELGYFEAFLPREQARMGHEVHVVTSDRYSPLVYQAHSELLGERVRGDGFFIEEGIRVWRLRTLFEISHVIWMCGVEDKIKELRPDIVHVGGIARLTAIRIAMLKKKMNNFKLIYVDGMTLDNSTSKLRVLYPLFRWPFSSLIRESADALVGVVDASRDFMVRRYGIAPERITVIPLGADDELFRFDEDARHELRSQLSLNERDIVFIYTGKIIPEKRLPLFVEAVKLMKTSNNIKVLKVLFVGNGLPTYIEEMKQIIRDAGLESNFRWHDAVPNAELNKFYSAADVAVWPRGASISQREAMACGLPIIISEGSMVTELVDYANGLICQEENPSHLAEQMERLLNPELRKEMGRNGRKFVEEKLSWKIVARQFIELVS